MLLKIHAKITTILLFLCSCTCLSSVGLTQSNGLQANTQTATANNFVANHTKAGTVIQTMPASPLTLFLNVVICLGGIFTTPKTDRLLPKAIPQGPIVSLVERVIIFFAAIGIGYLICYLFSASFAKRYKDFSRLFLCTPYGQNIQLTSSSTSVMWKIGIVVCFLGLTRMTISSLRLLLQSPIKETNNAKFMDYIGALITLLRAPFLFYIWKIGFNDFEIVKEKA